jgi:hypothetical protein
MSIEEQIANLIRTHVQRSGEGDEDSAASAAAAIAGLFAWQPISAAPQDGTHFLVQAISANAEFVIEAWWERDAYVTALDTFGQKHGVVLAQWTPLPPFRSASAELPPAIASTTQKWSGALEPLREKLATAVEKVVTSNRELFRDYVGPKAIALLGDDDLVTKVAEQIYPGLPFAVRIIIKEDAFAAFLLRHREPLIAALQRA